MADSTKLLATAVQALPVSSLQDYGVGAVRMTNRNELVTQSISKGRVGLADEGSYFICTNPTPGTGIASITAANGYDAAEALCIIKNGNASSGARIYLDYIKLSPTVAGTNGTNVTYATHLDPVGTRYTSGGTLYTPLSPNMASDATSGAVVHFGAVVTTAAGTNVRKIGSGNLRTSIMVVGDEYVLDFGADGNAGASSLFEGTLICKQVVRHAPIILGPGDEFILAVNAASQSVAASFEFEIAFWER